jgi:hypothetical protein
MIGCKPRLAVFQFREAGPEQKNHHAYSGEPFDEGCYPLHRQIFRRAAHVARRSALVEAGGYLNCETVLSFNRLDLGAYSKVYTSALGNRRRSR